MPLPTLLKNHARTHEESRFVICLLCWTKCKSMFMITPGLKLKITEQFKTYDDQNECLPRVVCASCKTKLYSKNDKTKITQIDFTQFKMKKKTRSTDDVKCECFFCDRARKNGMAKLSVNNVFGSKRESRMEKEVIQKPVPDKRCSNCLSFIHKGKRHICTKATFVNNIRNCIQPVDIKFKEQVTSSLLKNVVQCKGVDKSNSVKLSQPQGGKYLQVTIGIGGQTKKQKETLFSVKDFQNIRNSFNLSYKVTSGIATAIRVATKNAKIIEPNLKRKLLDNTHTLDHLFDCKSLDFAKVKGIINILNISQHFVQCVNLQELIKFVSDSRKIETRHLKFGIDGGGGFLKICLSIQSVVENTSCEDSRRKRTRQSHSDGIAMKKIKDSSVKKLFIIGLAPCVQENYDNVWQLWEELRINDFLGTIATDLKLANILVGIMSHSSTFPCCWCYADKNNLHATGVHRTVGNIFLNYMEWVDAGSNKDAKSFKNCINPPIIQSNEDRLILDLIPPPELHLLLGVVNTIFSHMLTEFEKEANDWAERCSVQRAMHHGGPSFNGNNCKILLNNLDWLRSNGNIGCMKYVNVFEKFNAVVDSTFTNYLKPTFKKDINDFRESYLSLDISVTPKVHAVFFHVEEFCNKHNKGLAFYSEQAMESVHYDFSTTWARYKVSQNSPDYGTKLLRAVCEYNSLHI